MKNIVMLLLAAAFIFTASKAGAQTEYNGLFDDETELVVSKSDFITLRKTVDKIWFEIPVRHMGREMLMASTLSEISEGQFGDVGSKQQTPKYIRFTLQDTTVHMRQINTAQTTDFAQQALKLVNMDPILFSFPVEAWGADSASVVIEMTDLFLDNPGIFDFFPQGMTTITPTFNRESSSLDGIKAFADNLSVKSTLAFTVSTEMAGTPVLTDYPVTARVTRSILLLPEDKMVPRITDSRVGVFTTNKTRFTQTIDGAKPYSVANRWRIVPSDTAAYARGELVEPTKQIVWYVDPDFPETWKEPSIKGIEHWNPAFEAIGFKNVIVARDFPSAEEDPDFDPDNLRYNCVRYLPSTTANAMGPSWVDPATGEIINASVIVWSNVIELINQWRFVQTAQLDPRVRNKKMPDEVIGESLQYVIAHEVGHTLGFPHNMAASAAWPADSLRSVTFTQKYGTTPSIMDYARHNYVAQPEDIGVKLVPPDLGVYDYYAVKWAYKYLPQFTDEWDEAPTLESWVDAVAGDPVYRYGRQQLSARYDPSSIEEDLSDDPVRASDYGVKNIKYIISNLEAWIGDDPDYSHRKMLYTELNDQYFRYVHNVMMNIGGIYLTQVKEGTRGESIVPVPKATQQESLRWVMDQYRNMDWLDDPSLKRHFPLGVVGAAPMRDKIANDFQAQIACVVLSSHYADSPYSIQEFMEDLYAETWKNLLDRRAATAGDRMLQKTMVAMFCEPLTADGGSEYEALPAFAPSFEEILAYRLDERGEAKRYAAFLRRYESEHGRGSVSALFRDNDRFGPAGMAYQEDVDISTIDDSANYLIDLAVRSRELLRSAIARSKGKDRVHYQALLVQLNTALKDKL
jgi:hypothetical protein